MTLRLRNVQIDVPADRYDRAVEFWGQALGAHTVPQQDGPFTHLAAMPGLVGLHLQRLGDGAPRVHLDLEVVDVEAETERLTGLGATRIGDGAGGPIMTDPGGNVFCVVYTGTDDVLRVATDDDLRLQVLVVDVASESFQATGEFWGHALGIPSEQLPEPFDAYIRVEGAPAVGGPMRVLVQDIGAGATPRVHLDLHVPDGAARNRHVERLAELGAEIVERTYPWTVMTDPVGTVFCVVPDNSDPQ